MKHKKWIKIWLIVVAIIPVIGVINYIVDPYGIYNTPLINIQKTQQKGGTRLIKILKTKIIKPTSICLGTSRAEVGFDPNHKYFTKPSYNLGMTSLSMYESKRYLNLAIKQGNLKKVLLVADYRMFNDQWQMKTPDFDVNFNQNIYVLLFGYNTFKDSRKAIKGGVASYTDGQRNADVMQTRVLDKGGHLQLMKRSEKKYYKNFTTNYTYQDTANKAFPDFEEIIRLSYENNIELDIIFGPSHIRQWESLNYHSGYDKWLQWKKDLVVSVNKIAKQQNKKQFRIMDFSVYHPLTAEKVPTDKNAKMEYYWEASHYKNKLGLIVLDRLVGDSEFDDFGVELNLKNIDQHLKQQEINRHKYIDVEKYQLEVFGNVNQRNTPVPTHSVERGKD